MKKSFVSTTPIFVVTENGEKKEVSVHVASHLYGEEVVEGVYYAILGNPALLNEKSPVALLVNNTVAVLQCNSYGVTIRRAFSAIRHGMKELSEIADSLWELGEKGAEYVCAL